MIKTIIKTCSCFLDIAVLFMDLVAISILVIFAQFIRGKRFLFMIVEWTDAPVKIQYML